MSIGVIIGASGGSNGSVGEIFLNNCMCIQWNVAGVQVNAGQKVVITGGRYGSNAFNSPSTSGGITIAGGADVTISGADLTPKVTNPSFPTQTYAIAIIAAVGGLYVRGCSMTGYGSPGPLYLSSPGTNIQITDCAGYNDVYGLLASSAPTSGHVFTAAGDYSYYGPVTFYVGNGTALSLHVETHLIPIPTGAFTLGPGESAQLNYTSGGGPPPIAPPAFTMLGN